MGLFTKSKPESEETPATVTPSAIDNLDQAFRALAAQKGTIDTNELSVRMTSVILEYAVKLNASDVLFDPHGEFMKVRFRLDGQLKDQITYARKDFPITSRLRVMANFAPSATSNYTPEDGRFNASVNGNHSVQFRISAFPSIHGDRVVLRVLNLSQAAPGLDNLGFAPDVLERFRELIRSPNGVFFVSGMTGSGKTTTLCSILQTISRPEINIMTLEDPVEYELPNVIHAQVNPKFGFSFADGLRSILRQSPNVIMVGEVRDSETAEISLQAALTGHVIFSTVHATTASGVINRLISMGIEPYMIASALIACLSQRLIRKVCQECAEPIALTSSMVEPWLKSGDQAQSDAIRKMITQSEKKFMQGKGCRACNQTGFKGRTGVYELLEVNNPIRNLIFNRSSENEIRRTSVSTGMKTLLIDAVGKVLAGVTTPDEIRHAITES